MTQTTEIEAVSQKNTGIANNSQETGIEGESEKQRRSTRHPQTKKNPFGTLARAYEDYMEGIDKPLYTEGVCEDGVAILRDGVPMTISQILEALND